MVTDKDGKPWRVGARLGVLVNAGGFAHNQRMRDQYQPGTVADWTAAAPGDTGEMIEEMMRHGAAIAPDGGDGRQPDDDPAGPRGRHRQAGHAVGRPPRRTRSSSTRRGVRYMNEGGSYMAYCQGMLERNKTVPAVPSWAIFDSQYMGNYMFAGTMPGSKKPQRWYDEGYLHKADTIEELAATDQRRSGHAQGHGRALQRLRRQWPRRGFPPRRARLRQLARRSIAHAVDERLGPIDQGAVLRRSRSCPATSAPIGGVVTDEHARVLREDGSVIPGLYATGVSTASVMGRVYPGAGCSVGPSLHLGLCRRQARPRPGGYGMTGTHDQLARDFFAALGAGDVPDDLLTRRHDRLDRERHAGQGDIPGRDEILCLGLCRWPRLHDRHPYRRGRPRGGRGPVLGTLVNGETFNNTHVYILRIRDGRVAHMAEHMNQLVVRDQIVPLMQAAMAKGAG